MSNWARIEELCYAALELAAPERSSFLTDACAGDEELRREVESLLAREEQAAGFLGESTLKAAAHDVLEDLGASLIGQRLDAYDVTARIGAGGMGEVYKARDTRLDRIVAIKVLSSPLRTDPQFRTRFDREAKAIAALTHPHICTLYDVGHHEGIDYLVMEYLVGETLENRLTKGALPLDQAVRIAIEIADALDKAHRVGMTHCDLKPGNVMLTKTGAKLLDFGLAKTSTPIDAGTVSMLPTPPAALTAQGTILGTLQYMAPEQVEGRPVDTRTDIFALGTVLYEMLTGKRAFEGRSRAGLIAAILEREPTLVSTHQPGSPPMLDAVVKKCLAKDAGERWQSAGDLAAGLEWFIEPGSVAQTVVPAIDTQPPRTLTSTPKIWVAMAVLGLTTIVLAALQVREYRSVVEPHSVRFTVPAPERTTFESPFARGVAPAAGSVSPNGQKLVFTAADSSGKVLLWVRPLDSLVAQPLTGTEGATLPFWSPDSRSIGFFAQGRLKTLDITGGLPQILCEARGEWGGTWNREGTIVFAATTDAGRGFSRVSSTGGEAVAIPRAGAGNQQFPWFLPDGHHFIYYVSSLTPDSRAMLLPPNENTGIHVRSLDTTDDQRLLETDSAAIYAPPGYLLFVRQGTLFAQPFDATGRQLKGQLVRLAESVPFEINAAAFSVSDNGVLTYGTGPVDEDSQLAWFDRSGKLLETVGVPGSYRGVDLSPDGRRIAVHRHDGSGGDAWVFEPRGTTTRLTFDPSQDNSSPIWSPDGNRIVFGSLRNGKWGLYQKLSDGTGSEELLFESDLPKSPMAWSPDGTSIIFFVADPKTRRDLWLMPMSDDHKPVPLLNSPFNEDHPQISPDGKWIAYASNETGPGEVYVKRYPSGNGKWLISTDLGIWPRWRRDGKEIFYLSGSKLMSVAVSTVGTTFEAGVPRELFDAGVVPPRHITTLNLYAVSPDGQRFLIPFSPSSSRLTITASPITVILNWESALGARERR